MSDIAFGCVGDDEEGENVNEVEDEDDDVDVDDEDLEDEEEDVYDKTFLQQIENFDATDQRLDEDDDDEEIEDEEDVNDEDVDEEEDVDDVRIKKVRSEQDYLNKPEKTQGKKPSKKRKQRNNVEPEREWTSATETQMLSNCLADYRTLAGIPQQLVGTRLSVLKTVGEMIEARGFTQAELPATKVMVSCKKIDVVFGQSDHGCILVFYLQEKLTVQFAREMVKVCNCIPRLVQIVVVTENGLTSVGRNLLSGKEMPTKNVKFFQGAELVVNYTKHHLVPKQRLMSAQEASDFLRKNRLTLEQLPKMLSTDPIAKFFGWEPGSVVLSTVRLGMAMEDFQKYRVVVSA